MNGADWCADPLIRSRPVVGVRDHAFATRRIPSDGKTSVLCILLKASVLLAVVKTSVLLARNALVVFVQSPSATHLLTARCSRLVARRSLFEVFVPRTSLSSPFPLRGPRSSDLATRTTQPARANDDRTGCFDTSWCGSYRRPFPVAGARGRPLRAQRARQSRRCGIFTADPRYRGSNEPRRPPFIYYRPNGFNVLPNVRNQHHA